MKGKVVDVTDQHDRIIVGSQDAVENALLAAHVRGVLMPNRPAVLHLPDGRVAVKARILEPVVPTETATEPTSRERSGRRLSRRERLVVGTGVGVIGATGMAGYAGYVTDASTVGDFTGAIGGMALVALVLAAIAGIKSGVACRRLHCPGCPHK